MLLMSLISLVFLFGTGPGEDPQPTASVKECRVLFRVDRSDYEDNYLGNSAVADKLIDIMASAGWENIDSVSVVAYASPEGGYKHNMDLSRRRAKEFDTAVKNRLGIDGAPFSINVRPGGEAWDLLRERVVADTLMSSTARDRILAQLDNPKISNSTRKWRFKNNYLGYTSQEGDVYWYLLRNHYIYLRCLVIKFYFKEPSSVQIPDVIIVDGDNVDDGHTQPVEPVEPEENPEETPETNPEETPEENPGENQEQTPEENPETNPEQTPEENPEENTEETPEKPAKEFWPVIGLSTNLLYDITYVPNYGLTSIPSFSAEYYPAAGHWTVGADVEWPMWQHWDEHRFLQIQHIGLWARRYISQTLHVARYGIGWNAKGWEGEGVGISAGAGWKWTFGRMFIDAGATLGFFYSRYDPYVYGFDSSEWYYYDYTGNPNDFVPRRMELYWLGPTRIYLSVGVDLFNRRRR